MSDDAVVNTKPQLEIFANDVKCAHGSTTGQIDPEMVFYLRSRGIEAERAKNILVRAFAGEVIDRMKLEPMRSQVEEILASHLPGAVLD